MQPTTAGAYLQHWNEESFEFEDKGPMTAPISLGGKRKRVRDEGQGGEGEESITEVFMSNLKKSKTEESQN